MAEYLHATTVALDDKGVALLGPPGAGKSDLALRLIDRGAVLVSDDQTLVERRDGRLFASAPDSIAGKLEVRGLGIVEMAYRSPVPLVLLAELQPRDRIERLPERAWRELCGLPLPVVSLDPSSVSAPERLQLALRDLGTLIMPNESGGAPARAGERAGGESVSDQTEIQAQSGNETQSENETQCESQVQGDSARRLVLVTGMSGAGRSTALRILEDEGYEAIDNLPLNLLEGVVGAVGLKRPIAVGVDIRTRDFAVGPVLERLDALTADPRFAATLLFVDCEDEVLGRRFTETRRRHPLAQDRPVADGIVAERRLLAPLRERADLMIDSSNLTPADFRTWLLGHVGLDSAGGMAVFVTSFSFRQGLPREADLVFDVRFLANPHYDPELRPLSGRDAAVADYIGRDPGFGPFLDHLTQMLRPLLPRYEREGKSYLTIAIGCTGGRHRSVFLAERLAAWLGAQGRSVHLDHRDIARDPQRSAARK